MSIPRTQRGGWPYSQPPNVPFIINRASPQAKGLVAWWPTLASRGGKVLRDLGGRALDGEFPGGVANPSWIFDAEHGWVLDYDGNDDYVSVGDIFAVDDAIELSGFAWVKCRTFTLDNTIFHKGATFGQQNSQILLFRDNVGGVSGRTDTVKIFIQEGPAPATIATIEGATNALGNTAWHHVGFTCRLGDGAGLRLYVDGVEDANSPVSTVGITSFANASPFLIGKPTLTANREFDGLIGDVRIYNRVLSHAEVWQMYAL